MKKWIVILSVLFVGTIQAKQSKDRLLGVFYLQSPFAHLHTTANRYAQTLTTLSCGHPIKVYEDKSVSPDWKKVKVANYTGYIRSIQLATTHPICWQDRYPRFFGAMNLEISDIYYWGKLFDQFLTGKVGIE